MLRTALSTSGLWLGILLLSGCATSHSGSFGGRVSTPDVPASIDARQATENDAPSSSTLKPSRSDTTPRGLSIGTTVETNDPALAAALFQESLRPSWENHLLVADEYRRLGILDVAHARVTIALAKAPRMAAAHDALARLWRDWGLPHEGLGAAYRAVYFGSGSAASLNTLGTLFESLGQLDQAHEAYQRALLREPTAAYALNNLCYVELRLGRPDEARSNCEAALRLAPALIAARNNLALTYAAEGDFQRARIAFLAGGGPAAAAYNLGIMHLAAKDYSAAADAFEQAIKARPNFTAAKSRAHAARLRVLTRRN